MMSLYLKDIVNDAALKPYRFLDLMRDNGMIPSETPRVVQRTIVAQWVDNVAALTKQLIAPTHFDVIDLALAGAKYSVAQSTGPQLVLVVSRGEKMARVGNVERIIRRRERARVRHDAPQIAA